MSSQGKQAHPRQLTAHTKRANQLFFFKCSLQNVWQKGRSKLGCQNPSYHTIPITSFPFSALFPAKHRGLLASSHGCFSENTKTKKLPSHKTYKYRTYFLILRMTKYYMDAESGPLKQETLSIRTKSFYFSLKTGSSGFQAIVLLIFPCLQKLTHEL